jgi:seryl-tRNA synthetase
MSLLLRFIILALVYKRTELPKSRAYRRSSVARMQTQSTTDSQQLQLQQGMAKLKTALQTLQSARSEASSTLAPILERMKRARDIRNAEKVQKYIHNIQNCNCMLSPLMYTIGIT